jgi:apolipoprotein N-acyltransferase
MKKKNLYLIGAAGVAAFIFSNGRFTIPALTWVAPIFLLRFLRSTRPVAALPLTAVLFIAAARPMLYGIIPPGLGSLSWLLTAYFGLIWFLPYLLDRLLVRPPGTFLSTLLFPCASVAVEYLNAVALGNWGSTALTQFDNLILLQILSVAGLWGITFLAAWFGPVFLWARDNGFEWRKIRPGISTFAGITLAALIFGGFRLTFSQISQPTVRIAGLHLGDDLMDTLSSRLPGPEAQAGNRSEALAEKRQAMELYFAKSAECARQGASVVFWPEAAVSVNREEEAEFLARASRLAREEGVYFMPAYHLSPSPRGASRGENKCAMFEPSGREAWRYIKAHPVPGSPDEAGPPSLPTIDTPFGRVGAAICYDLDFPAFIRQAGRKKVDIFLVPAWDWKAIDPLHSRMAACRAVENGFSMVRQTAEGLSLAVDGWGRTLAALDHFRTPYRAMLADVPTKRIRTLYSLGGDVLAWLSLAGLGAFSFRALFPNRRLTTRAKTKSGP